MKLEFGIRMTQREYRANIDGLNIFFGAVLGFVLAGTESLGTWAFAILLLMISGTVVSILYITASEKRISYAVTTALLVAGLPFFSEQWLDLIGETSSFPEKIQPTLAVWAGMTILIEFLPRDRDEPTAPMA